MLNGQKIQISMSEGFEVLPADKYTVLITNVNLVTRNKFQSIETEEVLNYEFTVLDNKEFPLKEGEKMPQSTRGRKLWKYCRTSFNEKSWLAKLVKAAMGRELTDEEKENFNADDLVGIQVDVMCEQKDSQDGTKTYNNILSFSKCNKQLEVGDIKLGDPEVVEKESSPITDKDIDNFEKEMEEENAKKKQD